MSGRHSDGIVSRPRRNRIQVLPGGALRVFAPGKINLNLLVGPREADGFHPVDSLVTKVSLYDELRLTRRDDGEIRLRSVEPECGPDEENLAIRAAKLLSKIREGPGVDVILKKQIPLGSGMGGGSSDAAAVLLGLNTLWGLGMNVRELTNLAGDLGSDVPLFLGTGSSRITGRGEHIEKVEVHPFAAVLILPSFPCATGEVYEKFDQRAAAMGEQLDPRLLLSPPSLWRGLLINQLRASAEAIAPSLSELRRAVEERAGLPVSLTGSGSGMFVLCDELEEAIQLAETLCEGIDARLAIVQKNPW